MRYPQPCVLPGTSTISGNGSGYLPFVSRDAANLNGTEGVDFDVAPDAFTVSNVRVKADGSPGSGKTVTWKLRVNPAAGGGWQDTGISVAIADAATSGADTTHSYTFARGDLLAWQVTRTGTPTARVYRVGCKIETSGNWQPLFANSNSNVLSNSATNYILVQGATTPNTTETNIQQAVPTGGVLSRLIVKLEGSTGAAKSYTVSVRQNASDPGSGPSVTITNADNGEDTTNSVSLARGDLIDIKSVPASTPTARRAAVACVWTPTVAGEAIWLSITPTLNTGSVSYAVPAGSETLNRTTEADALGVVAMAALVSKGIVVLTNGSPDNGGGTQSYTTAARLNSGATAAPTMAISEAATSNTSSWGSSTLSVADSDDFTWGVTPASTPTARRAAISCVVAEPLTTITGARCRGTHAVTVAYSARCRGAHAVTAAVAAACARGLHQVLNVVSVTACRLRGLHASATAVSAHARGRHIALLGVVDARARGLHSRMFPVAGAAARGTASVLNSWSARIRGAAVVLRRWILPLRGMHRVANDALDRYELFIGVDAAPDFAAAPAATFTALPADSPPLAPGATHHLVLRRRNRWGLISQNVAAWTVTLDGAGAIVATLPSAPTEVSIAAAAAGAARVRASYAYDADGAAQATAWLVYLTADGSDPDPDADTPVEVTMRKADGVARLDWTSGPHAHGATLKAIVRVRREGAPDADSTNADVVSTTASTAGPATPAGDVFFPSIARQEQ